MRKKKNLGCLVIVILVALAFIYYPLVAKAQIVRSGGLTMKINNGEPCTTSRLVTINHSMCTSLRPCSRPVSYRASEDPNFTGAPWKTFQQSWVYFNITSPGYGRKKIYFQTVGPSSPVVSDEIDLMRSCDDPRIMERLVVHISKLYAPFTFDAAYSFRVPVVSDGSKLEINIRAMAGKRMSRTILAQKTLSYTQGTPAGNNILRHNGTLRIPVGGSTSPAHYTLWIVAQIRPRSGVRNVTDYNPNNNSSLRYIKLVSRPQERWHVVKDCCGAEGSKNNILSPVGNAWVSGSSTLTLHDCGTTSGNEVKCDRNPVPGLGLRGVKWTRRPATDNYYGLHWYCEGYGNKQDNSSYGYYFRFKVRYNIIELRVE